ncbi:MAG: hypothetical protein ACE5NA_03680, partial [Nitrospiraceae bacterium]
GLYDVEGVERDGTKHDAPPPFPMETSAALWRPTIPNRGHGVKVFASDLLTRINPLPGLRDAATAKYGWRFDYGGA